MPSFPASNAYYAADIVTFVGASPDEVLGEITRKSDYRIEPDQRDAWLHQIEVLQGALAGINGAVFLEFNVPRLGSRLDAAVIFGPVIFPVEFKVGEADFKRDHINQVWDCALDLKNFHRASHRAPIMPILVCTCARESDTVWADHHPDGVHRPAQCNSAGLRDLLLAGVRNAQGESLDPEQWGNSPYEPTEFQIQGLELDWVCVTWDADLGFAGRAWDYRSFRGTDWITVHKADRQQYLRNAYRVLLTRARQGMVIFVPPGESTDPTRAPAFYDSTFNYLADLGVPTLR